MSPAKVAVVCGLMAVLLSACGIKSKPLAGTGNLKKSPGYFAVVDNPRTKHLHCLRATGLHVHQYKSGPKQLPAIQLGTSPADPTIIFYATPGAAQYAQIEGKAQGAEVIGSALLYPNRASDKLVAKVEQCTAIGVSG